MSSTNSCCITIAQTSVIISTQDHVSKYIDLDDEWKHLDMNTVTYYYNTDL